MCSVYNFSEFLPGKFTFSKTRKLSKIDISTMPRSRSCRIVYTERLELRKNLGEFKNLLADTCVHDDNFVTGVPEADVGTLISLPEIRDVLIFRTVVHYLDVASKIEFSCLSGESAMETQAVLIIERALQVLGEHLNESSAESVSLGKSLLISVLPADVRKNLKDIRDELSHMYITKIECRRSVENRREIFEGIVKELRTIRLQIEDIRYLLELLATEFVLSIGCSHIDKIQKMLKNTDLRTLCYSQKAVSLNKSITKERQRLRAAMTGVLKKIKSFPQHHNLRTHFKHINDYMFENNTIPKDDCFTKVQFHIGCLRVLFVHIFKAMEIGQSEEKDLTDRIDQIANLAEDVLSSDANKDEIQKETKEREEFVVTKYEEIYEESVITKSDHISAKYKLRKRPKRTTISSLVSKKRFKCNIPRQNSRDVFHTFEYLLSSSPTNYSLYNRKLSLFRKSKIPIQKEREKVDKDNDYPCIESLKKGLHYLYPINTEEKRYIIDRVPLRFKEHSKARSHLLQIFQKECNQRETAEEIKNHIQKLFSSSRRRELEKDFADETLTETNIDTLRSIKDYYGDLVEQLNVNNMITGKDFNQYCQCCFEDQKLLSDEKSEKLLNKCVKGKALKPKSDVTLKYLRDKIVVLENLLITSDRRICRIWPEVKSSKTKQHLVYRIKERYTRDFNLQAAVEMLLFDCMNILKQRNDLKRLWIKASNLFNGINLRNIFAHGNPLLEEAGRILDPDDLPSEIITKCLELVDDKSTIEAMCELLGKTTGRREDLIDAVKGRIYADVCGNIQRNARWESYASLISAL